ncbi:hypothetical protein TA3x_005070 [Tundrisphaera sp. TA3]|uniref:hypothetical protein n=1 Tax=Tundrisphaera sp. TA3 TaxID=3435775 RepID=UPI003EBE53EC
MRDRRIERRNLIVIVSIALACLVLVHLYHVRAEHLKVAKESAQAQDRYSKLALKQRSVAWSNQDQGRMDVAYEWYAQTLRSERLAKHHLYVKRRHERAANCPWIPLDSDPPEPL